MYIYYNPNPQHINAGDCVIRAIAKAFEIPWTNAYIALCLQGYVKGDWGSSNPVWDSYLREQGFKRYVIPNTCPDCYTVEKFAYDHPEGLYILATGSHVVTVSDGDWYDSWNSAYEIPIYYYTKEVK